MEKETLAKTAIVFVSTHHGNTKKLIDAIAEKNKITLINAAEEKNADLDGFDIIGFASGITFGKYYPQLLTFMENNLPDNKKVFFIHTAGDPRENQNKTAKNITDAHNCKCLGTYFCKGFDTYGPFKLIGDIAKGHPDDNDLNGAVKFYSDIIR
ncbi:MAG: flavodoxin [Firmicutes bacterium]|nr:flavodoxin [Bacillota bacterium]